MWDVGQSSQRRAEDGDNSLRTWALGRQHDRAQTAVIDAFRATGAVHHRLRLGDDRIERLQHRFSLRRRCERRDDR